MGKDGDLIEAARNGDLNAVDKILAHKKKSGPLASLRRGPGANAQDSNGFTALHHAAVNRHRAVVELLLSYDASPNVVDFAGSSALHLAAWSGAEDVVGLLLTKGPAHPNVNLMNNQGETPLHLAAQFGHEGVVRLLLAHAADPGLLSLKQETALDLAAQYGRMETVHLLLTAHPPLLAPFMSNSVLQRVFPLTPLHLASRNGHRNVVEALVKAGFNVNCRTSDGTALHEAALSGKVDVVKALLEAGVDVCVADSARRTAVDRLSEVGLQTPIAKEIAEQIRAALKKRNQQGVKSPVSSPRPEAPPINPPVPRTGPNHNEPEPGRERQSSFSPGDRRQEDTAPAVAPKKPPRRNLSASPTHSSLLDAMGDGRAEGWAPPIHNGLSGETRARAMSQHGGLDDPKYVSTAHIKLRDAKSEQNVGQLGLVEFDPDLTLRESFVRLNSQHETEGVRKLGPKPAIAPKPTIAPKPINIPKTKVRARSEGRTPKSVSMSALSPVDVNKELALIFGDAAKSPVLALLETLNMDKYADLLISNGFDDIEFLGEDILDEGSLLEIGILNAQHRKVVVEGCRALAVPWPTCLHNNVPISVSKWLRELRLSVYEPNFAKNLYTDPRRLLDLWNDELLTVLDIETVGHRRRILCASAKVRPPPLAIQPHPDSGLPIRDPTDLVSGVSPALRTAWRHSPETLIEGSVTYQALYVGTSFVHETWTTEAIQKAIQSVRRKEKGPKGTSVLNIPVLLIVSASIVSWYNERTKNLVREQEIAGIQCTCQASEDLRLLALVARGSEGVSASCHVFALDSVELATEAILTLGQAFEVAYQLANRRPPRDALKTHTRSKSANQLSLPPQKSRREKLAENVVTAGLVATQHGRSQSVGELGFKALSRAPIVSKEEL